MLRQKLCVCLFVALFFVFFSYHHAISETGFLLFCCAEKTNDLSEACSHFEAALELSHKIGDTPSEEILQQQLDAVRARLTEAGSASQLRLAVGEPSLTRPAETEEKRDEEKSEQRGSDEAEKATGDETTEKANEGEEPAGEEAPEESQDDKEKNEGDEAEN